MVPEIGKKLRPRNFDLFSGLRFPGLPKGRALVERPMGTKKMVYATKEPAMSILADASHDGHIKLVGVRANQPINQK